MLTDYRPGLAGVLMLIIYPIGIPCLYFVLTWISRHPLDPDPLFVVADVACGGKLNRHNVPVNEEMPQLANSITMIHGAKEDVRKRAIECHATKVAEQNAAHTRSTSEHLQRASDHRADRMARQSSRVRFAVMDRATKMRDHHLIPETWEDYLPKEAAVVIQLEASATIVEAELVHQYRNLNPSVQLLAFLVGAYEVLLLLLLYHRSPSDRLNLRGDTPHPTQPHFYFWESIECVRRLALAGLLVFFADGTLLQIIVASLIALASLYLYSKYRPYRDDRADSLASMAQLMIFFQVS